jgi:hypothetical protein
MMQAQGLAHTHGWGLIPHMTQPSIGNTANLHFVASQLHGWAPAELNDPSELRCACSRQCLAASTECVIWTTRRA